ncbi:hypothetical protein [Paenibacillus larvae]|uniref:Uncharacterized protein n=1 Tax=Paenibacillus larvae subsp. larvae TaxID=147375 RepID=A0A2L1U787_9BACL|nr:hypothetical protein [Paenibacillus larvae]AVF28804.1 hypothetical protein ERICIII_04800 [Paenibacillus larvae subsp. larvae]MCY9499066.1 hypothetical protein [Paenibacillus larvae]MCY9745355.1 hypothetical protein [Paenibacillus larvae]MCY9750213.1 hypothetical protein [Paenibacillus larvae]MDR5608820.1 hypothetical protein [Paenibacillus larvae]
MESESEQLIRHHLITAIHYYENDLYSFKGEEWEQGAKVFQELIIYLTRLYLDVRYCPRKSCVCSPEYGFNVLLNQYSDTITKHYKDYANELKELAEQLGGTEDD